MTNYQRFIFCLQTHRAMREGADAVIHKQTWLLFGMTAKGYSKMSRKGRVRSRDLVQTERSPVTVSWSAWHDPTVILALATLVAYLRHYHCHAIKRNNFAVKKHLNAYFTTLETVLFSYQGLTVNISFRAEVSWLFWQPWRRDMILTFPSWVREMLPGEK